MWNTHHSHASRIYCIFTMKMFDTHKHTKRAHDGSSRLFWLSMSKNFHFVENFIAVSLSIFYWPSYGQSIYTQAQSGFDCISTYPIASTLRVRVKGKRNHRYTKGKLIFFSHKKKHMHRNAERPTRFYPFIIESIFLFLPSSSSYFSSYRMEKMRSDDGRSKNADYTFGYCTYWSGKKVNFHSKGL